MVQLVDFPNNKIEKPEKGGTKASALLPPQNGIIHVYRVPFRMESCGVLVYVFTAAKTCNQHSSGKLLSIESLGGKFAGKFRGSDLSSGWKELGWSRGKQWE